MDRPSFWEQFREDPLLWLGPAALLGLIVVLAMLVPKLGG